MGNPFVWLFILLGVVAVGMMLFALQGLWGLIQARHVRELFFVQRRLREQEDSRSVRQHVVKP